VVDDNHLIRRLLQLILESAGHVAILVESGELALEIVGEAAPDLCIVDEVMPGLSGSELVRLLRRSRDPRVARVPIVGISAVAGAGRALLAAGATLFVPKPIEERAILAAVEAVLGHARPLRAAAPY
jgi:CheY-like chemotaxis protein